MRVSALGPLIHLCTLSTPSYQRSSQSMESRFEITFVTRATLSVARQNINPFIQTLHKWLVKPLPNGSALTAIFDSCNSGTLLGKIFAFSPCPLPLTSGKTLVIIGAIMSICHGSTRESGGAKPSKIAPVRRVLCVHHRLSPYHCVQSGRTAKPLALGPRADTTPDLGLAVARRMPNFPALCRLYRTSARPPNRSKLSRNPTATRGKGVHPRSLRSTTGRCAVPWNVPGTMGRGVCPRNPSSSAMSRVATGIRHRG